MNMGNYQVLEQIGATTGGTLHLARHFQDGTAVLLKFPARDSAADGLRHEYALLQAIDIPEILHPLALHEDGARWALVLEPFAGESLEAVLARQPRFPLQDTLTMACQLARAFAALHAAGIAHCDLRPANLLLSRDVSQVKLADLSRAASRNGATPLRQAAASDWAYVSPEQTGRMNRQADYRTDFYSLGILLYRLLTGQLPFQAGDPLEWVHCHLARLPVPPHRLVPDIPQVVSDLVLKLLAKVPEERYQSASGLLADLEQCLAQWREFGKIAPIALGMRDVSDRFQIPAKLYGREQERAALLAAFETVATTGTPMLVTVAGYSGVGKSALVHALQQPIAEKHGYFIAGKFDQYKRDIPYATLAQAFGLLLRQILGESDANIARWRDTIREALGPIAQLMVNLIPQLELVIGPQPPVPDLPPQEAQGRFQVLFRRFLGVFARQEHPLVLFLDDLQWVDAGTLAVLADLATHPDVRYLLLVGAYRDNEVDSSHPLMQRLEAICQGGGIVQSILLSPLALDDVAQLIAESMHCPVAAARSLAQLILDKTGGNPFFTRQFLVTLAEEKLLHFDASHGAWCWNLPRIQAKGYTDNVVDLMLGKLARLPQESQDALTRFACLGNTADAATLGLILERSADTVHALLWEAERAGLVYRQESSYTFLHDRVQEAAYSLIPAVSRAGTHLSIGRLLASGLPSEVIAERIFEVVSQLNRGSGLVESQEERERIAELNLLAGQRAKTATAYTSALAYLAAGAALLTEDCWERRHELIFQLELNRAECEFLTGAFAEAEDRLAVLSIRAASTVERAAVACLHVDLCTTLGQSDRAIVVGLGYLRHLGINWSPHPADKDVQQEYELTRSQLEGREIEDLTGLPLMTDKASLATMDVLAKIGPPTYFTEANLYTLVVCRAVGLSIERGNSPASCDAYARFGLILGNRFGNYKAAFRFGEVACELIERWGLNRLQARVYMLFAAHLLPYQGHVRSGRDLLRRAFDIANKDGDVSFAGYICFNTNENFLASSDPLIELQREAEQNLAFVEKAQFGFVIDVILSDLAFVRTLRGLTQKFGSFDDEQFDERQIEARFSSDPNLALPESRYWIRKLQALFLAGDYACAINAARKAERFPAITQTLFIASEYHFYSALSHAASWDTAPASERQQLVEVVMAHHAQLQALAGNCPENFENRAALIGAEIARIEGRDLDAVRLYDQAIRSAHDNSFVNNEAIAYECAARFYLMRGLLASARAHLEQARACYAQWGADGKVKQLEAQYPQLHAQTGRTVATPAESEARLDLLSVAKASQAISGQILLDELIDTLMHLVLESAGAQTGCLLLARDDELLLVAEARVEQQAVQVMRHARQPPSQPYLPLSMLNYVRRSREPVLLMETVAPHPFASDLYFAQQHPQSVLCLPILRQSALVGILYLENNLAAHAFTPDRVQVLELLASQAAISLDNARLYADVRDSHARIRRLVESSIIGIVFWNLSGGITDANEAFLEMVGYSRQDLLSGEVNWERMTLPEYKALDERKVAEVRATRTSTPYEKEFRRKDGSRVPVLLGAVLFDDSPDHGVAFVLDLSERKRAEAEREARHAAEAANRAKSAFLANMSHELRTPLNGILGYAQILERTSTLGERELAGVSVIKKSGEHLLTLINDILDLAKIEAGKMELYPVDFLLDRFVQTITEIIGVKAAQKGLELVCDLAPDLPQGVRADEKRLRQVLLNLLSNAVKFTDRGQITLRVRFASPAGLGFEVQDTGIGIAADQVETIFAPFEQAGDMRRRLAGTGLGLTISRQYVRLMGGDIQVESQVGRGSIFRFEVDAPPLQGAMAVTASKTVTGYEGPRKTVLVVDDIAENRAVVIDLLRPLGFTVAEASNGRDVLEMAKRRRPDLILMDIAMPELDGLEVTGLLRQQEAFRQVPIIAMSASVSVSDSEQSLAAGMNAFLPKPLDADKLLEQMGRLLRLEWIQTPSRATPDRDVLPLVIPPVEDMETLYRLARLGNMHDIMTYAGRLASQDEHYRLFADTLSELARSYQSQAVLRLIEEYRQAHFT
jgi:PAS domain S-box-containing protein